MEQVVVGRIGRAHGLAGEVTIGLGTDEPELRFAPGATLIRQDDGGTLTVARSRWHSGALLVAFAEVPDRTAAEALRGVLLAVLVDDAERPQGPEEYYDRQLVGLVAVTAGGEEIGRVVDVEHPPAQDLLVVLVGEQRRLVPFVTQFVGSIDLVAGTCVITAIPGLLDDVTEEAR
jgi:16S rRNA processing protein RimM